MALLDQVRRPHNGASAPERLVGITDMPRDLLGGPPAAVLAAAVFAVVAVLAVVVARALPEARVWVAMLVPQTAVVFAVAAYYRHYATYVAPALVLVIGAGVQLLVRRRAASPRWLVRVGAAAVALGVLATALNGQRQPFGKPPPGAPARAALADARCVNADSAGALAVLDVLNRNLERGCPLVADVTGAVYDTGTRLRAGRPAAIRQGDERWQRFARRYFTSADALVIVQRRNDGLSRETARLLDRQPIAYRTRGHVIYDVEAG